MDQFDRASELEQWERDLALAAQAQKAVLAHGDWDRASAKWCEAPGCAERIPDERRRAYPGVRLCVQCQARKEQAERMRR